MAYVRKILLSLLSGFIILLVTWIYQNYDYTLKVEDAFYKTVSSWRNTTIPLLGRQIRLFTFRPNRTPHFVFINTGKDLALVEDTVEYGNVAVSDREKIYRLMRYINGSAQKPQFTVLDIQFYYPYTVNPQIDTLLGEELRKNDRLLIPVLKRDDGYKKPLYPARYAHSDYRTFGGGFNKFRILSGDSVRSIPVSLHEWVDGAVYKNRLFFATCNDTLSLSAVWPAYFLKNEQVKGGQNIVVKTGQSTNVTEAIAQRGRPAAYTEYYTLGEVLMDMDANPDSYAKFFYNKLVIIGNFEDDMHNTPMGRMSGPVLLANLYLSLLNGQHLVRPGFFIVVWLVLSALSYVAWFGKMPDLKLNLKFLFSSYLNKFVRKYVTYFGAMFFLSILIILWFNVQVALFLPSLIYTSIESFRQKKYRPAPQKPKTKKGEKEL